MSSKQEKQSSQGKKRERSSDLSQRYREIGIKAVSAASRKAPKSGGEEDNSSNEKTDE